MKKRILLTGGSGAVGFEAFKELFRRRDDFDIRVFNLDQKRERKIFAPYASHIETIWGDLRNPQAVEEAVSGVDTILHIAAVIPPAADANPQLAREVNVEGTKNILDAMSKQANPPRLVYTSSISVYGDRIKNPVIKVGDALNPSEGDAYARTKIEAEKLIRHSPFDWTIFRLSGILYPKLKIQPLMFHMPLDTSLEFCHNSDTGFALVTAIKSKNVWGRIFNLGGGKQCRTTARDFIRKMLTLFGVKPNALPEYAFATQNFHSGYYADGNLLNDILDFQRHTLADYYHTIQHNISPAQRFLTRFIPAPFIKNWMLHMSEPFKAVRENNQALIKRFYGSRHIFENMFHKQERKIYR